MAPSSSVLPYFTIFEERSTSYTGKSPNPLVDLPLSTDVILDGIEAVIVSHLHSDHFDSVAQALVPKHLPLYCQPVNEATIRSKDFENVTPVNTSVTRAGVQITRTGGHHGFGEVGQLMGEVSGFVFKAEGEPTIYWAGDTVLCAEVEAAIAQFQPEIIITHSCGATWPDSAGVRQLIVMDAAQTVAVCHLALAATVIATHMEAPDHATVSRADLRAYAQQGGITSTQLAIPADGELWKPHR
jgi:L-ascorbate metabolism protein UlaG (beta-lactamase superfamily)